MNLDHDAVIHKAKLLLKVYRDVMWVFMREADEFEEETFEMCNSRTLGTALAYLSDFAPTEQRKDFERKVTCMFETQWLVELIDRAMRRVYNYPYNGKLYNEILSKAYVTAFPFTETELLETLSLERSVYYERKREAVMLLGVALWGFAIPELKSNLLENDERYSNVKYTYFTGFVG